MPFSFPYYKNEVKDWFKANVPATKRILDVGPGEGTYAILLESLGYRIDAIEIWGPYIKEYKLREKYDLVYQGDILKFDISNYDFIILGDVLEHIPADDAQKLIDKIIALNKECLVAIPYMMEQGIYNGNIHETHHQADLTPEVMKSRYPFLTLIYANEYYGYYTHMHTKEEKAYVLYANASYFQTVSACVDSIKAVSDIPIIVYMVNSNLDIDGAKTIYWECNVEDIPKHSFIDRNNTDIYKLLIQRPTIIKDALLNYAEVVAYVDADSVATSSIDRMFDLYPKETTYPYFVEGMYDWLQSNGRGGVETREELHKSLEAPACRLFNIDQSARKSYRQTGYFVAGQHTISFIDEWMWMCNHPSIIQNPQYYAPFHEETIANVLLWKYNITNGLPYIYVNADLNRVRKIYNNEKIQDFDWYRKPENNKDIFFFHGEKSSTKMHEMIGEIALHNRLRVLFLAPHLSTGGMPAFLLKRIEALQASTAVEIFVVEYHCYSMDYVVQRNKIINAVGQCNFATLYEDKMELFKYIEEFKPDIIHIDEMSERMDQLMITKLYFEKRNYKVIETCHDISFKPEIEKIFTPDALALCTTYHLKTFSSVSSPQEVLLFPIDPNKIENLEKFKYQTKLFSDMIGFHIVNIGLWTKGKNQGEMIEVARMLPSIHFHFVGNQAGNFQDYWGPLMEDLPNNVHVWGEREDAEDFMKAADLIMFNSTWECNPLVLREAISLGKRIIARNLPQYEDMFTPYIVVLDPARLVKQVTEVIYDQNDYEIPTDNTYFEFAQNHLNFYNNIIKNPTIKQYEIIDYKINQNFVDGPFLEITGNSLSDFKIEYYDGNNSLVYSNTIKTNHWVRLNKKYFVDWYVRVYKDDVVVFEESLNLKNKRVYIAFDSSSLGDTLAWMPYVEQFRLKHNCDVICSTFKNFLFEKSYPMIEFVPPGTTVNNIYAMYKLGWFYNEDMEPVLPNTIPLQQTATNILGLKYQELIPDLIVKTRQGTTEKYIVIATNSTAECKFWPKENWQSVITYLWKKGYKVINISKERNDFRNCIQIDADMPLEDVMSLIYHSKLMIGLSSGLSWLAWALKKHVVMIANFTEKDHEFTTNTTRLVNKDVCHGCWNSPIHKFDKSNWRWCPIHENTDRQFECQKSISPQMVKEKLKLLI